MARRSPTSASSSESFFRGPLEPRGWRQVATGSRLFTVCAAESAARLITHDGYQEVVDGEETRRTTARDLRWMDDRADRDRLAVSQRPAVAISVRVRPGTVYHLAHVQDQAALSLPDALGR